MQVTSYAKVNLTLDVGAKRATDGYHPVRTVMVPITLADEVSLESADFIQVYCEPDVAGDPERNLAYRAAELLRGETGYTGGALIRIRKRIPVAGGLAGGSTNGAATLVGLNQLWGLGLPEERLTALAIRLGSDVPFFVPSRPALVTGIGEVVQPITAPEPLWLVLATPAVAKSTGGVYALFDELTEVERPDTEALLAALATGDVKGVANSLGNVFEQVMLPRHPEIGALKAAMLEAGALGALMSGAGPSVFGVAKDQAAAERIQAAITALAPFATVVQTLASP
ncbi:MAG TPA: 4-(cytidine 5'-diphospho)-2-C-methyl-D-erythritol kinase [Symbiobacteriaceae bacterium]|nr:4-(cytidine 5'-diphospho)-2-C-methyl-D-erythritol kinase [Symbiobacteriaceae bacterium]